MKVKIGLTKTIGMTGHQVGPPICLTRSQTKNWFARNPSDVVMKNRTVRIWARSRAPCPRKPVWLWAMRRGKEIREHPGNGESPPRSLDLFLYNSVTERPVPVFPSPANENPFRRPWALSVANAWQRSIGHFPHPKRIHCSSPSGIRYSPD